MSTKDFIKKSVLNAFTQYDAPKLAVALLAALALGILIYLVYRKFYTGVVYSRSFAVTLVGMCVLTCMVTLAISTNVVISLGMVGALSIVRFRTAVKDPLDLLYLFWSITTGITAGAGMYALGLVTAAVMIVMIYLFSHWQAKGRVYIAVIHYVGTEAGDDIVRALRRIKYAVKSKTMRGENTEMAVEVFCKDPSMILAAGLCLLGMGAAMTASATKTRTYAADDSAFPNAQIGYAPMIDTAEAGDATLRYLELTWREAEPEEGVYAWEAISEKYDFASLREQGIHLVLRFVCDVPGQETHLDIPDWLYAQTKDGSWYDTDYGKGYSPNYANAVFRAAHHRVLYALAEFLGTDGFVSYVELGSLGHWGEWHIKSEEGLVPMPDEAIRDEYAADYLAAFPTAKLLMRRPFRFAAEQGLGLYNDMTGEEKDTMEWLGWIAEGGWYGDEPHALSAMPTFWQDAPVGGEFTSSLSMRDMLKELPRTLHLLEASHMSFLGPKTAPVKYAKGYNAVLKQLGYRLRVTELKLTPCADGVYAELTVANEGAAPFYWEWPVNLYVEDAAGSTLYTARLPLSLPKLMPGDSQKASVKLEGADAQELLSGGWKRRSPKHLTIGIVDPMTSRDAVRFAMKSEQKNGRTVLL